MSPHLWTNCGSHSQLVHKFNHLGTREWLLCSHSVLLGVNLGHLMCVLQVRVVAESSPLLLERNSVCFTTTRKGENRTSIDLEKVPKGHKIDFKA